MSKWSKFWSGMNIRKLITLLFGLGFIIVSIAVVSAGLDKGKDEMVDKGISQLSTLACMCVSYYMGYSNKGGTDTDTSSSNTNKDNDQL